MTAMDMTALEASVEALIQQRLAAYEAQLREALARMPVFTLKGPPDFQRQGTREVRRPQGG
jgi:hypothetical protein